MIKPTLTPKQEKFCQQIVMGKTQSDAYRAAFKPKRAKKTTIHVRACELMKLGKVKVRIAELKVPVVASVRKTREELLDKFQSGGWFDPRQMFDTHGNPHDIPALPDNEAMMLEGFEIVEEFSGKGADRIPVGYTRKFKLSDRHKYLTSYGKMMGFIDGDDDDSDEAKRAKSMQVVFVNVTVSGNGHGNGHAGNGSTVKVVNPRKVNFVGTR